MGTFFKSSEQNPPNTKVAQVGGIIYLPRVRGADAEDCAVVANGRYRVGQELF